MWSFSELDQHGKDYASSLSVDTMVSLVFLCFWDPLVFWKEQWTLSCCCLSAWSLIWKPLFDVDIEWVGSSRQQLIFLVCWNHATCVLCLLKSGSLCSLSAEIMQLVFLVCWNHAVFALLSVEMMLSLAIYASEILLCFLERAVNVITLLFSMHNAWF